MKKKTNLALKMLVVSALSALGCGGRQTGDANIEVRPLEEMKAAPIIEEVLAERGYAFKKNIGMQLPNGTGFDCDYWVDGQEVAIEFLSDDDRRMTGPIPPAAEGSRLHVIAGRSASDVAGRSMASFYVFFIDARKFTYHVNPTSEVRADVTFLEVDSRLRRDLADFLSWYEEHKQVKGR